MEINPTQQKCTLIIGSELTLKNCSYELISKCKNENTFKNPEFLRNELTCRSNWKTNRFITTYKEKDNDLVLSRGFTGNVIEITNELKIDREIEDHRISAYCTYPTSLSSITLRSYQERAVSDAMKKDQGVIVSPTGSGKSLIGLELIRRRGQKSLILVHRSELAKQWIENIKDKLGIEAGIIGDGHWNIGNEITVAMIQTLSTNEQKTKSITSEFGLIISDESHHLPCKTFFEVISWFPSKYRYGLSATLKRSDNLEEIIYRALGKVISTITKQEVEELGATIPVTVLLVETGFRPKNLSSWNDYLESITHNNNRNDLIIDLAIRSKTACLILVDRVEHAEKISEILKKRNLDHVLAHGKISKKDRKSVMDRIKSSKITIGTSSLLGEGIDISFWDTLVIGSPISSEIKLLQAIGRIVRPNHDKEKAIVYDLKDNCGFSGSSFNKRFEIYKKNNIWVEFNKNKKAA